MTYWNPQNEGIRLNYKMLLVIKYEKVDSHHAMNC
jgi:hypothetical protein